jgi:hypothetical protein
MLIIIYKKWKSMQFKNRNFITQTLYKKSDWLPIFKPIKYKIVGLNNTLIKQDEFFHGQRNYYKSS